MFRKIFFTFVFLLSITLLLVGFTDNAYAAGSCNMNFPGVVELDGSFRVNVFNARLENENIIDGGRYYLKAIPVEGGVGKNTGGFDIQAGSGYIDLDHSFFPVSGFEYKFELYRRFTLGLDPICESSGSILPVADVQCDISLQSTTVEEGQKIILVGNNCETGSSRYQIAIEDSAGNFILNGQAVPVSAETQSIYAEYGPFEAGTYKAFFTDLVTNQTVPLSFTVEINTENVFLCGSDVPAGTPTCTSTGETNCCPVECPYFPGNYFEPPTCACGGEEQPPCDPSTGKNECDLTMIYDESLGICVYQYGGNKDDKVIISCGEQVPEELVVGEFECEQLLCPWDHETRVCQCGEIGQGCCPGNVCNDSTAICYAQLCELKTVEEYSSIPKNLKCAIGEQEGISTAIGCFLFDTPYRIISNAMGFLLGLGGSIALILIAFASFRIMTSSGDPRSLKGAQELLVSAIAGLVMVALSAFILRFIGVDLLGLFTS